MNVDRNLIRHWAMLFESEEAKDTTSMLDEAYDDYDDDLMAQAEEVYQEQLMRSQAAGGSDPYGDAEYAREQFLKRHGMGGSGRRGSRKAMSARANDEAEFEKAREIVKLLGHPPEKVSRDAESGFYYKYISSGRFIRGQAATVGYLEYMCRSYPRGENTQFMVKEWRKEPWGAFAPPRKEGGFVVLEAKASKYGGARLKCSDIIEAAGGDGMAKLCVVIDGKASYVNADLRLDGYTEAVTAEVGVSRWGVGTNTSDSERNALSMLGKKSEDGVEPTEVLDAEKVDGLVRGGADLADFTVPDGIRRVKADAFQGRKELESVTIPKSVGMIDPGAFKGCTNLKDVFFDGRGRDEAMELAPIDGTYLTDGKVSYMANPPK